MDALRGAVLKALGGVVDPEVGLDIVAMGLIYGLEITGEEIRVTMTLTSPGCPLGETLYAMVSSAVAGVAGSRKASVQLAWQPNWEPDMISAEGRRALR